MQDAGASGDTDVLWCAVERRRFVDALFPTASFRPGLAPPSGDAPEAAVDADEAAAEAVRGQLDVRGPVTVAELAAARRRSARPG